MIIVTGATGFVGSHLTSALSHSGNKSIRALTRRDVADVDAHIEYVQTDLSDRQVLRSTLEPGAILVNLAYSNTNMLQDAIESARIIAEASAEVGIKRLIHCSSISVYGRVSGIVTEDTPCMPLDRYGQAKLAVERALLEHARDRFELVILRPTEVFGNGGKALHRLLQSLLKGHSLVNYARASLFNRRSTHLLPVEALVDAIQFFCTEARKFSGDIFNVSADEHPLNNFRAIEHVLREELDLPDYLLPPLPVPPIILRTALRAAGRVTLDDQVRYSAEKLARSGFQPASSLEASLRSFVREYRAAQI